MILLKNEHNKARGCDTSDSDSREAFDSSGSHVFFTWIDFHALVAVAPCDASSSAVWHQVKSNSTVFSRQASGSEVGMETDQLDIIITNEKSKLWHCVRICLKLKAK